MASILASEADCRRLGVDGVDRAFDAAQSELERIDRRFSHYSADSHISTWLTGGAVSPEAVAEFDRVIRQCTRLREESDGVFTIKDPRTGAIDTAGYVKGYAIDRAAGVLREGGVHDFLLCVGGDTVASGRPAPHRAWRVAVADPTRARAIAAIVDLTDLSIATSGMSERGDHIWSGSRSASRDLLSFTVIGPDMAEADAYATIGFAMGEVGIAWVAQREGYRSLAIRSDGTLVGDAALVSAA
jgi:thiamine biosynthesis lipoprotein